MSHHTPPTNLAMLATAVRPMAAEADSAAFGHGCGRWGSQNSSSKLGIEYVCLRFLEGLVRI